MNSATSAARTAAQLHQAAQEVAGLATRRRRGEDVQVTALAASQRLELAITRAENLLSGDAREAHSGDTCDLLRQACTEMAEAARNYLRVTQLVECGH